MIHMGKVQESKRREGGRLVATMRSQMHPFASKTSRTHYKNGLGLYYRTFYGNWCLQGRREATDHYIDERPAVCSGLGEPAII